MADIRQTVTGIARRRQRRRQGYGKQASYKCRFFPLSSNTHNTFPH